MSFLDAFQSYHQTALAPEDQDKTSFITLKGNYYNIVMSFRLKNARVMHQQMVIQMFKDQIGETIEVYIDDMVVKSRKSKKHMHNLVQVFEILWQHKLRLHADKCAFGVGLGKFLGYMIATRGIEVNPDQITTLALARQP